MCGKKSCFFQIGEQGKSPDMTPITDSNAVPSNQIPLTAVFFQSST